MLLYRLNTGYTQKNGAVSIIIHIETAPFFCVCPVLYIFHAIDKIKYVYNQQIALNSKTDNTPTCFGYCM
jgi:hypothetical protein